MREVEVSRLYRCHRKLCIEANAEHLPEDVKCAIKNMPRMRRRRDCQGYSLTILLRILILQITKCTDLPGYRMACVFLEIGQDVHFTGGDLTDAINEGVRRGYTNGYLRKSVVVKILYAEIQETIHRL